jgi:hypothetical protein
MGGDRFAIVLDFECLSRPRSAMQTMTESALVHFHLIGHEFAPRLIPVRASPIDIP